MEKKWSACQYKTGQDWNRGRGIGLAMQSMSARYVTKLSLGHQPTAQAAKASFPLPPYNKDLQPPSIRLHTRARHARKKRPGEKPLATEGQKKGGLPGRSISQHFLCKHQSMEQRVAEGAAPGCMPDLPQPSQYPRSAQTGRHSHHAFNKTPSSCPRYPGDLGNTSETIFPTAVTTVSSKGQLHKSCVTCHIYLRCY